MFLQDWLSSKMPDSNNLLVERNNSNSSSNKVLTMPEVRDRFLSNPARLLPSGTNDFVLGYASDFLRAGDVESIKTRQNAGQTSYLASGKIDIATTPTINFTVGGSFDYSNRQSYNRNNALLNADNNIRIKETHHVYRFRSWRRESGSAAAVARR